jgi:hypothetical protein
LRFEKATVRDRILAEIRKIAEANGGRPPGWETFAKATGIRLHEWRGVYWSKWSDATREAGFEPNTRTEGYGGDYFLRKLVDAARHFGAIPNTIQMAMYRRLDPEFPARQTFNKNFASRAVMLSRLAEWVRQDEQYSDIAAMLVGVPKESAAERQAINTEGLVYLIKSGAHYKIGRSDELERRVKEIRIALPEAATLVHSIRTDDPSGIEAYWHRRFSDKRANGEWFKLTSSDVAAFKRRKFQ